MDISIATVTYHWHALPADGRPDSVLVHVKKDGDLVLMGQVQERVKPGNELRVERCVAAGWLTARPD